MRINPKDEMAGLPVLRVRDALKKVSWTDWTADWLQDILHLETEDVARLLQVLQADGLIEPYELSGHWRTTSKGNRFVLATARPVSRTAAQRHLDGFRARVLDVRDDDRWLYKVQRAYLFGSFLNPNMEVVGDVDLAVSLVPKVKEDEERQTLERAYITCQYEKGRRFQSIIHELICPHEDVWKYLKSRSRILSLHPESDIENVPLETKRLIYADVDT